jgi:hypothetical protein
MQMWSEHKGLGGLLLLHLNLDLGFTWGDTANFPPETLM